MNEQLLIDLNQKVDKVNDKLHSMDITLAKQEINLQDHMERTSINEKKLGMFEVEIRPAVDAYKFVAASFKILAVVVPIVLTIIGIYVEFIKN